MPNQITYEVAVYTEDAARLAVAIMKLLNEDAIMDKAPERVRMAVFCAALGSSAQAMGMAQGLINVTNGWPRP